MCLKFHIINKYSLAHWSDDTINELVYVSGELPGIMIVDDHGKYIVGKHHSGKMNANLLVIYLEIADMYQIGYKGSQFTQIWRHQIHDAR